jgi:hypothetical protein
MADADLIAAGDPGEAAELPTTTGRDASSGQPDQILKDET